MNMNEMNLHKELKKYFGFDKFKGEQEKVIYSLLSGNDTFVLMPTGGGKSLTYQLPALMSEGVAIIVSPLIALMKNQVDSIRGISENKGIAHVLNSSLNKGETERVKSDIKNGVTKLLYVAPESLTKDENVEFFRSVKLSFFAIDEAHCISEWGHDFRPEYRNLRAIISKIGGNTPIIALTATATPKVQEDIQKTLGMNNATVFKASFNRANLFYEIRPKVNVNKELIKFAKQNEGKSGIVYCLSRKKVEEIAQMLQVNGINALPYHAGLDAKTRAKHQDNFLMEDVDVIVATIAFGMGIDKPDVRYVIHHDMPKSLESYYQETGRAGRDGGEGHCISFYAYKDIEKLEKFLVGKPIAEMEVGNALLQEVVSYAETSISRRKFLLHYFGEEFDEVNGDGADMDDNTRNPKPKSEAGKDVKILLDVIKATNQKFKAKEIVFALEGKTNALISTHKTDQKDFFGIGTHKPDKFWMAALRQVMVAGLIKKDIETYGVVKLTEKGEDFIASPKSFMIIEDHNYDNIEEEEKAISAAQKGGATGFDKQLFKELKELRKKVAKQKEVPPFAIFQDPSLEDMALQYPITLDEMKNIFGVGEGKAKKYGKKFIDSISKYVDDNNITRPDDLVIKTLANKSTNKVYIIQKTDQKFPLTDIAKDKSLSVEELLLQMEAIINSGTKININYEIDSILDEDQQDEIYEYFMEAETDAIENAVEEFDGEYTDEEIRMMRIRFMSEVAN
ncbi:MAG: RecQ family ATP-dependent DNA helicase [Ichthyobacteriaceae bacterium]|nr:RecQ family ATP-dependent DNA helicase [Ichthyobacteriaceae bacterium]